MAPFVVSHTSPLPPEQAWERVTDWARHGKYVPFTTVAVTTPPPAGTGTVFVARTGGRRIGFDDVMQIVEWAPPGDGGPGHCRIEKTGRVILGWAELTVEPLGAGSRTTWREEATPARMPRFAEPIAHASSRLLFGRVLRKLLES